MSEQTTEQVAAGLAASILAEAAGQFPIGVEQDGQPEPVAAEQPVVQRARPSNPAPAAEAAPEVQWQEDSLSAETAAEEPDALPDFTPLADDELDELLAEPDIEAEVEAEVAAEYEQYGDSYDPDEARRIKTLEKRNQYLEQRLVDANKGKWVQENLRKYPLLATYFPDEVGAISATSRRAFAREAQKLNERYSKALAKPLADIQAARTSLKGEVTAEVRQQAAQQWGLPTSDPAGSPAAEAQAAVNAELQAARARGASLQERIAIMAKAAPPL